MKRIFTICLLFSVFLSITTTHAQQSPPVQQGNAFRVTPAPPTPAPPIDAIADESQFTPGVVFLDLVYPYFPTDDPLLSRVNLARSGPPDPLTGKPGTLSVNFALDALDLSAFINSKNDSSKSTGHASQVTDVPIVDNAILMLYCDTTRFVDNLGNVRQLSQAALAAQTNTFWGSNLCNTVDVYVKMTTTGSSRVQWLMDKSKSQLATAFEASNFTEQNHRFQKTEWDLPQSFGQFRDMLWSQKYCRDAFDECMFHGFSCSSSYQNTALAPGSERLPVYNLGQSRYYPFRQFHNLWSAIESPAVAPSMPADIGVGAGPFGVRMSTAFANLENNAWLMTLNRMPPLQLITAHEARSSPADASTLLIQFEAVPSTLSPEGFYVAGALLSTAALVGICLFLIVCKAIVPRILFLREMEATGGAAEAQRIDEELIEKFEKERRSEEKRNATIAHLGRVTGAPLTPEDLDALETWTKLPVGEMIVAAIMEERKREMKEKLASVTSKFAALPRVLFARALRLVDKRLFSTQATVDQQQQQAAAELAQRQQQELFEEQLQQIHEQQMQQEEAEEKQQQNQRDGERAAATAAAVNAAVITVPSDAVKQHIAVEKEIQKHLEQHMTAAEKEAAAFRDQEMAAQLEQVQKYREHKKELQQQQQQQMQEQQQLNSNSNSASATPIKPGGESSANSCERSPVALAATVSSTAAASEQRRHNANDDDDQETVDPNRPSAAAAAATGTDDDDSGHASGIPVVIISKPTTAAAAAAASGGGAVLSNNGSFRNNNSNNGSFRLQPSLNKRKPRPVIHLDEDYDIADADLTELLSDTATQVRDNVKQTLDSTTQNVRNSIVFVGTAAGNVVVNAKHLVGDAAAKLREKGYVLTDALGVTKHSEEVRKQQQQQQQQPQSTSEAGSSPPSGASTALPNAPALPLTAVAISESDAHHPAGPQDDEVLKSPIARQQQQVREQQHEMMMIRASSSEAPPVPAAAQQQQQQPPQQQHVTPTSARNTTGKMISFAQVVAAATSLPPLHSTSNNGHNNNNNNSKRPMHQRSLSASPVVAYGVTPRPFAASFSPSPARPSYNLDGTPRASVAAGGAAGGGSPAAAGGTSAAVANWQYAVYRSSPRFETALTRHMQEDARLFDACQDELLPTQFSMDEQSSHQLHQSRPADVPHCRRCGDVMPFVDLFAPCQCTSTSRKYIHRKCLEAERRLDAFADGGVHAEFCWRCRHCRGRYTIAPNSISVFGNVPMKSPLAQTLHRLLNNPVAPMLAMWVLIYLTGYFAKFLSATLTLDYVNTDWSALRVYHWVVGAWFLLSFSLCERQLRPFFEIFEPTTRRIVIMVFACIAPLLLGYIGHFVIVCLSSVAWTWETFFGLGVVVEAVLFFTVIPRLALFAARGAGTLYDKLPRSVQRLLQKVVP